MRMLVLAREIHVAVMEEGSEGVQPSLTITEILGILQNPPETCITAPPQKPKAGQVFLYKAGNAGKQGNITSGQINVMPRVHNN